MEADRAADPKVERRYRYHGRKRINDRSALTGILFVLQTGIPWEYLPQERGCGSGMTTSRAFRSATHNAVISVTIEADEAWLPPTIRSSVFGRSRFA